MKRLLATILLFVPLLAAVDARAADPWPTKPVKIIATYPPGGLSDVMARLSAQILTDALGKPFIVENKPGASGVTGTDFVAKSPPDGYTLVMGESSNLTINPSLYPVLPFDPAKDLAPIVLVGTVPLVLVVAPTSPYDSAAAIVAAAKSKPLSFASSGSGTVGHLVAESWKRGAGVDLLHVPYKGGGPAVTDVMGGQVDLHFASLPAAVSLIKSGKLRALAVTSAQRVPQLPDVPTMAEAGFRDADASVLYGLLAPAGTSPEVLARVNAEVNRVLQMPEVRDSFAKQGVVLRGGSPEQFAAFLVTERGKWSRVVKESGAKAE